ncbi:MAG: permease [Fibrobacterota bacterium]
MNWKNEWKKLVLIAGVFLAFFYLPVGARRFDNAVMEALHLAKWYAREHVVFCLITAFFIAGAIGVFVSQSSVMKYLGAKANKVLAYGVASVSGTILAVCSCTVLPLFNGIYRMGAGLGPATTFLYSGPAINVLAIVLTARILGLPLGIARALGAIVFSIVIGILMQLIFRKEEQERVDANMARPKEEEGRPLWQTALYFFSMVGILVFANWGKPDAAQGVWFQIFQAKWIITSLFAIALGVILIVWFNMKWWKIAVTGSVTLVTALLWGKITPMIPFGTASVFFSFFLSRSGGETEEWFSSSWGFAKQILPLLFWGVLIAGFLLGRPDQEGVIPSEWVYKAVGGNSLRANFFASFAGAFMYFATLTEVPILQGLIGNGMGQGPALALLLAGPALSLPNMLVIRSVLGTKKTAVFVSLVVVMATISGVLFGVLAG